MHVINHSAYHRSQIAQTIVKVEQTRLIQMTSPLLEIL